MAGAGADGGAPLVTGAEGLGFPDSGTPLETGAEGRAVLLSASVGSADEGADAGVDGAPEGHSHDPDPPSSPSPAA